jgi:hypothetical protein
MASLYQISYFFSFSESSVLGIKLKTKENTFMAAVLIIYALQNVNLNKILYFFEIYYHASFQNLELSRADVSSSGLEN